MWDQRELLGPPQHWLHCVVVVFTCTCRYVNWTCTHVYQVHTSRSDNGLVHVHATCMLHMWSSCQKQKHITCTYMHTYTPKSNIPDQNVQDHSLTLSSPYSLPPPLSPFPSSPSPSSLPIPCPSIHNSLSPHPPPPSLFSLTWLVQ